MSAVPPARRGAPDRSTHEQRGASSLSGCHTLFIQTTSTETALGGVDGFDEDEAESEGNHGAVVLDRLLAAKRHPLEALELAHKLLDLSAGAIERVRKEAGPVLG